MTIEFRCPHCDKLLKTPDDKAGVRANCPGCRQVVTVPDPALEAAHVDASFGGGPSASDEPPVRDEAIAEPESSPGPADEMKPCPMCGAPIRAKATRCKHCGETLVKRAPPGSWAPTRIDAGNVLTISWEIYQKQLGILVGAFAIWVALFVAILFLSQIVLPFVMVAAVGMAGGGGGGGGNAAVVGFVFLGGMFAIVLLSLAAYTYLEAGMTVLMLRVAKGENAEIADLFGGGRYFLRHLGMMILFAAVGFVMYFLILLPGIVMRDLTWTGVAAIPCLFVVVASSLRIWATGYFIVDLDHGLIESFRNSILATSGNWLAVFVLALAAIGINLLGTVACLIGTLFTAPLIRLIFAVAYCGMTGQLVLRREQNEGLPAAP